MSADFRGAFAALRDVLKKHSAGLMVQADTPVEYTLVSRAVLPNKQPMWFGCVRTGRSAVSYHLMPLYFNPKLQAAVPAALRPRKQGKTCFNFKRPDPTLFAMLDELTRLGREGIERAGFLKPGPVPRERFDSALRAGGEDPEQIARVRAAKGKRAAAKRAATVAKKRVSGALRKRGARTAAAKK
jgi:hypothetical protein